MGIRNDVFGLEQIYQLQIEGNWSVKSDVWLTPSSFRLAHPFGYFAGGNNESLVHRIDYNNDTATASTKGPLSSGTSAAGATGNASFGYVGGGESPTKSTVDRIDYGNDTATASPKGPLSLARLYLAATGNSSFGYFGGGFPGPYSTIDRVDYSNDTATAVVKGPLSSTRYYLAATGNANFGYFGGGNPSGQSTVRRVDYSNDTVTTPEKGPLSLARGRLAATGNSSFGYFGGGFPGPTRSTVDRIDYSNDTATAPAKGPLSVTRERLSATGNADFGYFSGGQNPSQLSTIDRVDYSNDTATASPKGPLTVTRTMQAASSSQANAITDLTLFPASSDQRPNVAPQGTDFGYFGGGFPGPVSKVERIDYSNDTATASTKGPLSAARRYFGATGNASFGYFIGGAASPSSTRYSTVDRVDYSNDTPTAVAKGPLSLARFSLAATGNADFGYVGGGKTPSSVSSVERIDYSNDTAATAPKGPLSAGRYNVTATGNQNFGYFGGGSHPVVSTVDRIDYSNDTATASPKGPLSLAIRFLAATGNSSFGYFGGGFSSSTSATISTVDRIDYSNDTGTASTKGPLGTAIERMGATGNTSFGYFGGGQPSRSTVDRIDYANDTATALAKGPLSAPRQSLTATSSRANAIPLKGPGALEVEVRFSDGTYETSHMGYFGGGENPYRSSIQRIDFANDTATAVVKSSLTSGSTNASQMSTFGNTTNGYWAGSTQLSSSSYVNRLDYYNDTATTSIRGNLPDSNAGGAAGFGNNTYGYVFNGYGSLQVTSVRRVDFSNDTVTGSTRGPTTATRYSCQGVSNQSYGYITGKWQSGAVERIDFSNDTASTTPVGSLTMTALRFGDAIGNSNYGWVGGGDAPSNSSKIDRIDYSNDTATASTRGPLTYTTRYQGATGNDDYGYFVGGQWYAIVNRIDYSNDTVTASPKGSLSSTTGNAKGISARESGYSASAAGPAVIANSPVQYFPPSVVGYFGGGLYTSPSDQPSSSLSSIDRINFANDTSTTLSSALNYSPAPRNNMGSVASSTHGYWVAGLFGYGGTSDEASDTTRLDFSNDTGTLVVRGNLAVRRGGLKGVGNSNSGYLIGGNHFPGYYNQKTIVDRIDYSNDSVFTTVGSLDATIGRTGGSAVGNENFGYYAGGYGLQFSPFGPATRSWSDIFRIDYSNDTSNAPVRAQLNGERYSMAAAGNANFGYFSGGYLWAPPTYYSSIIKYDYANDTTNASPTANLTGGNRFNHMGTGDQNHGYFAGGGSYISSVEKFDYSNDTTNASPKGPLSGGNRGSGAACSAGANGLPN
jgi:hypothetical protein